jgi:hypothetical protein
MMKQATVRRQITLRILAGLDPGSKPVSRGSAAAHLFHVGIFGGEIIKGTTELGVGGNVPIAHRRRLKIRRG